jgi:hypothetical protein
MLVEGSASSLVRHFTIGIFCRTLKLSTVVEIDTEAKVAHEYLDKP